MNPDQPAVVIYSKPRCVQCNASKLYMSNKGIIYTEVDASKDESAAAYLKSLGYTGVPVTVVETGTQPVHWYGFVPPLIDLHFGEAA